MNWGKGMKIRTRLKLNTWFAMGVIALMMLSLTWTFREVSRMDRNENMASEMRKVAFEKILLRDDYLLLRGKQARMQWQAKSETMRRLLESAKEIFTGAADRAVLQEARQNFEATFSLFSTIIARPGPEEGTAGKKPAFDERESRLIGQIFLKTHAFQHNIDELYESAEKASRAARNRGVVLVIIFFVLGGGMAIVTNSFLTRRIVEKRLTTLHKGVMIIGGGNLDYRIAVEGDDELADLAGESNQMAVSLKESHTSIEILNREITERRQVEIILRETARLLEMTINSSPLTIIAVDHDDIVTVWNPAAERLFGWPQQEVIGHPLPILPDDKKDEFEKIRAIVDGKETAFIERSHRRKKDGSLVAVDISIAPITNAEGRIIGRMGILTDITERIRAEAALRETNERLSLALEVGNAGIWEWDLKDDEVRLDDRFHTMLGYTPGELPNTLPEWLSYHHPEDIPVWMPKAKAYLRGDSPFYESEHRIRNKAGTWSWVFTRGKLVNLIPTEPPEQFIGIAINVTESKRVEEEIRKLNAELEQRVVERTAQLEIANKELEAFAYSISHDLKAPLRAVDGYAQILIEDHAVRLDDEGRRVCEVITNNARRMGKLIDDLLAFSRTGRAEINPVSVDMATLANSIFFELTTPEERERIDFHVAPLPRAIGDPTLLRQVWMNLLGNAVKFSAKKERAVIEVGCAVTPPTTMATSVSSEIIKGKPAVVYFIRDNGAGFDMAYVGKLFAVFQRLHSAKEYEGTGVGLAIVQRIVQRHGGRIWAEGEPGKGAIFHFTLDEKA